MNQLAPGSLLAQSAPANTTAAALFTASLRTEITSLLICNVTGSSAKARVFLDEGGTTYAVGNALYYDVAIPGNTTLNLDAEMYGGINLAASDSLGIRTDTANALTFSLFGVVQQTT
jgi:hypothetical protein